MIHKIDPRKVKLTFKDKDGKEITIQPISLDDLEEDFTPDVEDKQEDS